MHSGLSLATLSNEELLRDPDIVYGAWLGRDTKQYTNYERALRLIINT